MTSPLPEVNPQSLSREGDTLRQAYENARFELTRMHVQVGESLRQVFRTVTEVVASALNVDRVGIWLYGEERRSIRCHYLFQSSRNEVYEGTVLHQRDFPRYFQALETCRVIPVSEAQSDPLCEEFRVSYFVPLGITSMLDAPIYRGGQVVGVVCHEHIGAPRCWTPVECDFAVAVAEVLARLFEEAARQQAETSLGAFQRHLMELHRMEALGRLAAGIAHDFRNVLTVILGQAELLLSSLNDIERVKTSAQMILDAGERGRKFTQELLAFGKESPNFPQVVALCKVLKSLKGMLELAAGRSVALIIDCPEEVSRVFIDVSQLERAILNLVLNARDAMPRGGELRIEVCDTPVPSEGPSEATYVMLAVVDNGVGMAPEVRSRAFDPFFTTKDDKGTGLGLAIVHQIVTRAGGFLVVDSQIGQGTAVRMFLPRIAGK